MPALALGVAGIGAVQLEGEQCCFFASGAGAAFHDDVARIARVLRDKPAANLRSQLVHRGGRFCELRLGERAHLRVTLRQHRLGLGGCGVGRFPRPEHVDNALALRSLLRQLPELLEICRHFRAAHFVGRS